MTQMRFSVLAWATAALIPAAAGAQLPDGSTRMINVRDSATRVLTLALENREEGQPVLFLHAGAGAALESWGEFIFSISDLAPVVAYDRPGIGESELEGAGSTPERAAAHANELLMALDVPPPYILVGHSWGGALILYYAGQYPDDVVGMVYLDPMNPRLTRHEYLMASNEDDFAARTAEYDAAIAALNLPPGREAEQQAIIAFQRTSFEDRGLPEDPDVPTALFLAGLAPALPAGAPSFMDENYFPESLSRRIDRFTEWAGGRADTTLILATDASHFVHRSDPALATEAVRRVVDAVGAYARR